MSQLNTNNRFAAIESSRIPRSSFDLSCGYKTTFDADELIPFFVHENLPGDTMKMRANMFARMNTPIYPLLDNLYLDVFWFDCPIRLVFDNFRKLLGEQDNPGDSTDYLIPSASVLNVNEGSIGDYMGIPPGVSLTDVNILPFRCLVKIWNAWFRDQNLQDSYTEYKDDSSSIGLAISSGSVSLPRGKRHDYFTSCLPYPQKLDNPVSMPLGDKAYVTTDNLTTEASSIYSTDQSGYELAGTAGSYLSFNSAIPGGSQAGALYADLSSATAATITALRTSVALQQMAELNMRAGTRVKELTKAHFGVTVPDMRLQRPEFLGGTTAPVNINPISQTSSTDTTSPQGNVSANATIRAQSGFTKSFVEHSYTIGLMSVRADINYSQGLSRMWSRSTKHDFFWPGLQNISEMGVKNKEIYADGSANDDLIFGYQEQYADYKYRPSLITGKLRSSATTSLDAWHLAEDHATLPVLGDTFIKSSTPMGRVTAIPTEPDFLFDCWMNITNVRPMQVYATPGLARL